MGGCLGAYLCFLLGQWLFLADLIEFEKSARQSHLPGHVAGPILVLGYAGGYVMTACLSGIGGAIGTLIGAVFSPLFLLALILPLNRSTYPIKPTDANTDDATWRPIGVAIEGQAVLLGDANLLDLEWRLTEDSPISLAHPACPNEFHSFDVVEAEHDGARLTFAVSELSTGIWGFYEPVDPCSSKFG